MTPSNVSTRRPDLRKRAIALLDRAGFLGREKQARGRQWTSSEQRRGISNLPGLRCGQPTDEEVSTALMEAFRVERWSEAFELLVQWTRPQLMSRVRARARFLGVGTDAEELLQDAYINIFRYPDKFDASRPGAFHAWASTIVDNAIRRKLRKTRANTEICFRPIEFLVQEPDEEFRQPTRLAMRAEAWREVSRTFSLFLVFYLQAYKMLNDRERWVLHRVEVDGMRYAALSAEMGIRPEALKMVVFRARRRIQAHLRDLIEGPENTTAQNAA